MPAPSGLRVGVAVPQAFVDEAVDVALVRRFAERAEAFGFDDLWVLEQITGANATLEPLTQLSYLAACTERVRLGVAVLVINLRNPLQLAKAASSLDHLSAGRLTLGVGLGTNTREYAAFGLPPEHRVSRFVEGIEVMKALWTQPRASLAGRYWQLEDAAMEPKALQQPHPPLWFGARAPEAMRRAARLGQGWIGAGSSTVENFTREIAAMRAILLEAGRDEAEFPLSKRVYIAVGGDRGKERIVDWLRRYYGPIPGIEDWAVTGSASECVETLQRLRDQGSSHVMLNPVFDHEQQLEIIAEEVVPRL